MANKHFKQYFHDKATEYTWEILPITTAASTITPQLFFIKCDDTGTRLTDHTGYAFTASSVRIEGTKIFIDSDMYWFELTEDNVSIYDGAEVSDIDDLFYNLTGLSFA